MSDNIHSPRRDAIKALRQVLEATEFHTKKSVFYFILCGSGGGEEFNLASTLGK